MANFIIKPAAGDTLKLQDEGGDDAISISATGVSTIANATITAGTLTTGVTFPAGHIIQMNYTRNVDMTISRTGDKRTPALTGITCVLANDLQASSKLFAQVTTQIGEEEGNHWATQTFITLFNNSVDLAVAFTDANDTNQGAGLGSMSYIPDNSSGKYESSNVAGQILFTPTGSGAARRTVELAWGSGGSASFTSWLNRTHTSGVNYRTGGTTIVLMEVAQ